MMRYFLIFMLAFAAVSCGAGDSDFIEPPHVQDPDKDEKLYKKEEGAIRLVSYNVGIFSKYINSIDMVADMMIELKADAVCLNELDSCTTRTGYVYQTKVLAEKMGNWHQYFARAMWHNNGAYGEGMVVSPKYKNNGVHAINIPKGTGSEPRVCAVFKTDKFVFMATHLEHTGGVTGETARLEGVRIITEWARKHYGDSDIPVFLCGDMNCEPNDAPILKLNEDWKRLSVIKSTYPTGPGKYPKKCIDFIFALKNKAQYEVLASDVPQAFDTGSVAEASDHIPIYVDVRLK